MAPYNMQQEYDQSGRRLEERISGFCTGWCGLILAWVMQRMQIKKTNTVKIAAGCPDIHSLPPAKCTFLLQGMVPDTA